MHTTIKCKFRKVLAWVECNLKPLWIICGSGQYLEYYDLLKSPRGSTIQADPTGEFKTFPSTLYVKKDQEMCQLLLTSLTICRSPVPGRPGWRWVVGQSNDSSKTRSLLQEVLMVSSNKNIWRFTERSLKDWALLLDVNACHVNARLSL